MNDPYPTDNTGASDEDADLAAAKAASRRRDWGDVAGERRTPEQVRRDHAQPFWGDIDFTKLAVLNENEACMAPGDDPPSTKKAEAEKEGANQPRGDKRIPADISYPV